MAHDNIHFEPNLISQYQKEYLTLINYYTQLNRTGIFIKYYNINLSSTYDNKLFSTYDHYSASDIKFDIYEYTPIHNIQTISNRSTYNEQTTGDVFEGVSSITVNTISRPRINDLIYFYSPIHSQEIFRVINISTVSNMLHSEPNVNWYELDIEYAPIENIDNLTIFKHYIYDLSIEEYTTLDIYRDKLTELNKLTSFLFSIKTYYNLNLDVYLTNDRYIPLDLNNSIYELKTQTHNIKYTKTLIQYPTPYGYEKYVDDTIAYINKYSTINSMFNNKFQVFDLITNEIIDYEFEDMNNPINDLETLILLGFNLSL